MTDYQTRSDIQAVPALLALAPVEGQRFMAFNMAAEREDGAIPRKYRELIAVAVACTTQCPYCIEVHTKAAKAAGATREELVETAMIAAALRAGGGKLSPTFDGGDSRKAPGQN